MFILYKNARRFASQRIEREVSFSKKFYSAAPLCRPSKKTERRAKPFRASIVPGGMYGGGLRALPQFAMVVPRRAQSALAALPCSLGLLRPVSATGGGLRAPHQFPLKSYGFSGAETARKRFSLWKMGFSSAKIAPSPPYTPPGTIEAKRLRLSRSLLGFFDKLRAASLRRRPINCLRQNLYRSLLLLIFTSTIPVRQGE